MGCPECGCSIWSHRKSDSSKSINEAVCFFKKTKLESKIKQQQELIKAYKEAYELLVKAVDWTQFDDTFQDYQKSQEILQKVTTKMKNK